MSSLEIFSRATSARSSGRGVLEQKGDVPLAGQAGQRFAERGKQLIRLQVQRLRNLEERGDVQGDLAALVFGDRGPAFVDGPCQLLKRQAPVLTEGAIRAPRAVEICSIVASQFRQTIQIDLYF